MYTVYVLLFFISTNSFVTFKELCSRILVMMFSNIYKELCYCILVTILYY